MVARALRRSQATFRGVRPFNPARDTHALARLLEEAFRADLNFPLATVPILRKAGIVFWMLSYLPGFPEARDGFVWIEDSKVVGNATLTFDHSQSERFYVSNVAVKTEYHRQGIARALMQAAIEHVRQRHGKRILLYVRPNNPGALKLYADLEFHALEMRGEWKLDSVPLRRPPGDPTGMRPLKTSDRRAVSEWVRAAASENVHPFRPEENSFEMAWDELLFEAIGDFLSGQKTSRLALERDGKLAGLALVRGQHIAAPHKIVIQVHPAFRGRVEDELVITALQRLSEFPPREIRADATNSHPELIRALEHQGFRFLNGLTLMELVL